MIDSKIYALEILDRIHNKKKSYRAIHRVAQLYAIYAPSKLIKIENEIYGWLNIFLRLAEHHPEFIKTFSNHITGTIAREVTKKYPDSLEYFISYLDYAGLCGLVSLYAEYFPKYLDMFFGDISFEEDISLEGLLDVAVHTLVRKNPKYLPKYESYFKTHDWQKILLTLASVVWDTQYTEEYRKPFENILKRYEDKYEYLKLPMDSELISDLMYYFPEYLKYHIQEIQDEITTWHSNVWYLKKNHPEIFEEVTNLLMDDLNSKFENMDTNEEWVYNYIKKLIYGDKLRDD